MEDPHLNSETDVLSPRQQPALNRLAYGLLAYGVLVLSLSLLAEGEAKAAPGWSQGEATAVTRIRFNTVPDSIVTTNSPVQLFEASDGFIYGPKRQQNTSDENLYRVPASGGSIDVLGAFPTHPDGCYPSAPVEASDGNLYGVVMNCGANDMGALYRMNQDGSIVMLFSFAGGPEGLNPMAPLTVGHDGFLYGFSNNFGSEMSTTPGSTFFRTDLSGHVAVLYRSTGNEMGEPSFLRFPLVQTRDGNFYGVSVYGGEFGLGTIFKITSAGQLTVLHSFSSSPAEVPAGGLVEGPDGALYGLTEYGGRYQRGNAYRITPQGAYSVLVDLPEGPSGALPSGQLLLASDGNFYGVASFTNMTPRNLYGDGEGVVFRITPAGEYRVIHYFDHSRPHRPINGVIETSAGTLTGVATLDVHWSEKPTIACLSLFSIKNWRQ